MKFIFLPESSRVQFANFMSSLLFQTLYKEKSPPRPHIKLGEGRFGVEKKPTKHEPPGPTSYKIEESYQYANQFRG